MVNTRPAENGYYMRDAEPLEDRLILVILRKMNCVYSGGFMKLIDVLTLPAIISILAAVTVYVILNRLSLYILLVPLGILCIYGPNAISSFKASRQNSGIKHDIKKSGEHFLIGQATCTGKNENKSFWGKKRYTLSARLRNGKSLQDIPAFEPYYNDIKVGREFMLIISSCERAEGYFAVPDYVLKPPSKTSKPDAGQTESVSKSELRLLNEADRKIAMEFGAYRNKLRIKYYGRAYLTCSVITAAFFAIAVMLNSRYINLLIAILCCLGAAVLMNYVEWRQFKKMISGKDESLDCLDAEVSAKTAGSENREKYIEIEDLNGKKIYRSTAHEDYKIFEKGDSVLLIYKDGKDKPIICLKSMPT